MTTDKLIRVSLVTITILVILIVIFYPRKTHAWYHCGTDQAESDCPTPSPTVTPTEEPTDSPSPSPTINPCDNEELIFWKESPCVTSEPSATPSASPSATPTTQTSSQGGDGSGDGRGCAVNDCSGNRSSAVVVPKAPPATGRTGS